jgi:hypothetical protein
VDSQAKQNQDRVPSNVIIALAVAAWLLVLSSRLELTIEFGSLTFIYVSLLVAIANFRMRKQTTTSVPVAFMAIVSLAAAGTCMVFWQAFEEPVHLAVTLAVAMALGCGALWFARRGVRKDRAIPPSTP